MSRQPPPQGRAWGDRRAGDRKERGGMNGDPATILRIELQVDERVEDVILGAKPASANSKLGAISLTASLDLPARAAGGL